MSTLPPTVRKALLVFLLASVSHVSPPPALAQNHADRTADEISANVLSPFCPGRLLKDCPSSSASELKNEIRERAAKGESKDDIVNSLYARYGDKLRAVPATTGFGSLAWYIPFVFLGAGSLIIYAWLRRSRLKAAETPVGPDLRTTVSPEMQARIEKELGE